MIRARWTAALSALAMATAACSGHTILDTGGAGGGAGSAGTGGAGTGGNPLVGMWSGGATFPPTVLGEQVTLGADGTATAVDTFGGIGAGGFTCMGSLVIHDMWTATSTTFSVSGGTCTGQVVCPNGNTISCGTSETEPQTCTYTLSNGNTTLVLDCPAAQGPLTFTRQG
jgi:hypothetical protein